MKADESVSEAKCVTYRPSVYKISMARMNVLADILTNCECTGLKEDHIEMYGCVKAQPMWFSRNFPYERPWCVTGTPQSAGL